MVGFPLAVVASTTPVVIRHFFEHLLHTLRRRRGKDGTAQSDQISYDEGLAIIRQFLQTASKHTVEDLQRFTQKKVPAPSWVRTEKVTIPEEVIDEAATILNKHFETDDVIRDIGGKMWWTVRGRPLTGEFVEMAKDRLVRERAEEEANAEGKEPEASRVLLYIHGGAYFMSSIETHRYQVQRHARKFNARAFSPSYRLAPQYPFPCALLDVLACYLHLINPPPSGAVIRPDHIVIMGDSAGAGMALVLMTILRDMNLPLPAAGCLISPWVDLTHSFPSVVGDASGDYVPQDGFHFKPSLSWPPPQGNGRMLRRNGKDVMVHDQVQLYCSNNLINHPLVSPILQGSLGGLPPLKIIIGSSEILRDEGIYLAHKAASPETYPPADEIFQRYPTQRKHLEKYQPTKVHLQVFDSCCHVTPTLAFASPAKYIFRAAASFNLWAVKAAQKRAQREQANEGTQMTDIGELAHPTYSSDRSTPVDNQHRLLSDADIEAANADPLPEDAQYEAESSSSDSSSEDEENIHAGRKTTVEKRRGRKPGIVITSGVEPPFVNSMVRQRISIHGQIREMEPSEEISALSMAREKVGIVTQPALTDLWLSKREEWDTKYAKKLHAFRADMMADRKKAEANDFAQRGLQGENIPLSSMAGWFDLEKARICCRPQDEPSGTASPAVEVWMRTAQKADMKQAGPRQVKQMSKRLK